MSPVTRPLGSNPATPANIALQNVLRRLAADGPEHQAIKAGEIDAVVDYASSNVILLPVARRALRGVANRARATNEGATNRDFLGNHLLAALPQAEYRHLLAGGLEPVWLKFGEVLHEPGVPFRYVYFPIDCVISLLTTVGSRRAMAVGLVGNEGMVGVPLVLGIEASFRRALVQGTGTALRMESGPFHDEILRSRLLQRTLNRFKHALVGQIAQFAVCNKFHSIQARLARYLLMTSDRVGSREFNLQQEFIAKMLGVRRVSVTVAAGALRKRNLISYQRGKITILDRNRLSASSCECYRIIKKISDSAYVDS